MISGAKKRINEVLKSRFLINSDIENILLLRQEVWDAIVEKSLFAASSRFYVENVLNNGFGIGYFAEDEMIACILCKLERGEYGELLELSDEDKRKSADIEDIFVKKEYRGLGLQKSLIEAVEQEATKRGKTIFLATVSPDNQISFSNFLEEGYRCERCCTIYEGLKRYVLSKNFLNESEGDRNE